ncbi:VanW family protein [Cohnella abietis]|uniref:G5 domain-containing protein n=1 Tax=Cohnella abietis TaxID=2507935 RepID=A0A3T1DDE3_9BACL|nr:VanW family protein [Cohnella abietis]BBI36112.1 hypothetical protein KCTCHS21_55110 [Cohnella abietis]
MKKGLLLTFFLVLVVAGAGVGGTIYYGSDTTLPDRFIVSDLELGGQSPDAALRAIQTELTEAENTTITFIPPDKEGSFSSTSIPETTWTLKQLGMTIEATDAVKAVQEYRDASLWDRAVMRYRKNTKTDFEINVSWDDEILRKKVASSWGNVAGTPSKEATRIINDQDEVVYTPEVIGTKLDIPSLLATIKTFKPKSLSIQSDVGNVRNHTVTLPILESIPEVTVASLKEEGISRKLIEFTTAFTTSGEGRSHNVTVAAKALNETLLMPGEIFEYGKIVDKADKEFGYKEAPVILKGKLTPGIGGGICQVSSTLYNAALLTGLDIVERRNHSLVVHYLPKGLDATFADGFVNFKFRNSTGKQLLIRTVVKDKTVTVKLFGTMPDNVSYRTETEEVKVNQPKIVYVANDKLTIGKQEVLQKGEPGYVIESYRIKLVNGEVKERKKLSKDTYRTQDSLIAVNPNDPRLNPEGSTPSPGATPSPGSTEGPVEPV